MSTPALDSALSAPCPHRSERCCNYSGAVEGLLQDKQGLAGLRYEDTRQRKVCPPDFLCLLMAQAQRFLYMVQIRLRTHRAIMGGQVGRNVMDVQQDRQGLAALLREEALAHQ